MYFEGWYMKHVDRENNSSFAIIPGVFITDKHDGLNLQKHNLSDSLQEFKQKYGKNKLFTISHAFVLAMVDGQAAQYYAFDL